MTTITLDRALVEQALHVAAAAAYPMALISGLRAALAEPVQEPTPWLRAIDEAMIDHHCGVVDASDDYETAKRKLNILLCSAQTIGAHFAKQAEPQEPVAWRFRASPSSFWRVTDDAELIHSMAERWEVRPLVER